MQITADGSGGVLKIAGALDISVADELRDSLRDWLARQPDLRLDLSEVESLDTATVQVLRSARKTALKLRKPFMVLSISPAALETRTELGLTLEDPALEESPDAV